jgi:hypothetical protein
MPEKFVVLWFCATSQSLLGFHPSRYLDDSTQVAFIGSLLIRNALSWFVPFSGKHSLVLQDIVQFETLFIATFGDSNREKVVEITMQSLHQGIRFVAIYAA